MFLTCQVDLPVAMTMKSAQAHCFFAGITFTLSALTSLRICSTSWSSKSPKFWDKVWLKLGNPSLHCWRSCEEEDDDGDRREDWYRRAVHMESRLSISKQSLSMTWVLSSALPSQHCSVLYFLENSMYNGGWRGIFWINLFFL